MPFDAPKLLIAGLIEINLPGRTLRFCDGGFVYFQGEKFASADAEFGAIESVESVEERVGDEAPGGRLTFLPVSTAAAATLSSPSYQGSRIRFWLARVIEATGAVSESELIFDGELDTTTLRIRRGMRALDMEFMSIAERLFSIVEGNVLSPRFHKTVFPGELGFDNASGISLNVAWGTQSPPRGYTYDSGGGGGGGFRETRNVVAN